jgi:DNA-binding IclR family transcriptional regulator
VNNHPPEKQNDNRYNIRVLDRAFRILSLLSDGKARTLQELSEGIELSTSTTFRLLSTLSFYRYVQRNEQNGQYSLGLACLELSQAYYESNDLRRVALPELETLRDEVKETVHLAVLDQMEVVYLEKLPGLHAIGLMGSRVGGRAPSYCTGVGKVLLAYLRPELVRDYYAARGLPYFTPTTITTLEGLAAELDIIRRKGYALDRGEHEDEVRCVATPIFNLRGEVTAALSISGPAGRMEPLDENCEMVQQAVQTAGTISMKLGYNPAAKTSIR